MFMLIFVIVAIVAFLLYQHFEYGIDGEAILGSGLVAVLSLLVSFLIMVVVTAGGCCAGARTVPVSEERVELLALKDNNVSYVRRYCVNDFLRYNYLYKIEDKGITSGSIPAENTFINYTAENEQPYLIKRDMKFENPVLHFLSGSIFLNYEYSLYIPEGSIIVEDTYEINLE